MEIAAAVRNSDGKHEAAVRTGAASRFLDIPGKPEGGGSAVNGGELLMLALATCYCNDLYREAERMGLDIEAVDVEAAAEFPDVGLAATNIRYSARVKSSADPARISMLLRQTDAVAEVHNTLRAGVPVQWVRDD